MVKGIEQFREHFAGFENRYTLIGGSACYLAMAEAGVAFRATKDLDLVIAAETLDASFVGRFWDFIKAGGYESRKKSTGERRLYRFHTPKVESYPYMIELFSRIPDAIDYEGEGRYTPLSVGEEASSLSALLMNDAYYELVQKGTFVLDGISILKAEYIVLLKAKAWLDLTERREKGENVKGDDIRKHKNDPFRLFAILSPDLRIEIPQEVQSDLKNYLQRMAGENIDLKNLGITDMGLEEVIDDFRRIYGMAQ
ncbi:MAG: hypothetical protein R2684_04200 [Pyrinomonadaceae bacterium]